MKNNKKGFTLVELLAVIVILGVLLVIAVPAINTVMEKSRANAAKDNAVMVARALETCNMSEQIACGQTEVADYIESSGSTITITRDADDKLTKFEVVFKGYTITATGTDISISTLKTSIQNGSFTGKIMTLSI